jgi:DNA primase
MRFPPQFLDELRSRLPVSDVVGRRVKLRKAGREWKGLSPFNKERTPSFFVNDQKGFYHDFSSGKHGDIFRFVMETEGVDFPEAVERLAGLAGVAVPKLTREAEAQENRRHTLHQVCEEAAAFFEATLASRAGAKARGYLADRGLDPSTQLKFRLGYAPAERFALKEHLGNLGISVEDMVEAGLLVTGDDIPVPYDRFRNRVMFPIADFNGRVVAFGGRALDKDAPAKYLNSPETPLFHKGAMLYNGATARQAAHRGAPVIAVEGYVDVIAMVTAGYAATVAPLGTALTTEQMALLWKMANEPILCFDGDAAGRRAAYRAIDLALPLIKPGKSLLFATLPDGHDPDDLVRSGGPGAIADVLAGARPLGEVLWGRETDGARIDTPERRAGLEARVNELTNGIGDEAVRRYYRQDLRERMRNLIAPAAAPGRSAPGRFTPDWRRSSSARGAPGRGARPGTEYGQEPLGPASARLQASSIVRGSRTALPPREALILIAACNHPWLIESHAEELADLEFLSGDADLLRRSMLDAVASLAEVTAAGLREALASRECGPVLARIEKALTHFADWPAWEGAAEEDIRQWWHHVLTLHRKNRTLNRELKEAERALGDEPSEENFARLQDVRGRLEAIDGTEASIEGFGASSGRASRGL